MTWVPPRFPSYPSRHTDCIYVQLMNISRLPPKRYHFASHTCVLVHSLCTGSELPCYKKTNTIFTPVYCHQATSIWTDFHSVNLSRGQQEKDAHGVILGVGYELDWKAQESDLMILVNSVQVRIVYILSFHLEQSCINAMWTVTHNKSQNQWRHFQRTVKLRIPKYKKALWHSWILSE